MKSLSLSRPLVIMMLGIPGSGKSFFAEQFSDTFGAPLISADRLRQVIYPEANYTREEEGLIWDIAVTEIYELLKTKKTFIIDGGTSSRTARTHVSGMARKAGYNTLLVWVQTDETTARTRSTKKLRTGTSAPGRASLTPEAFDSLAKKFTRPSQTEKYVVISGKHTYATQAKVVLRKLVEGRDLQPQRRQIHINPDHTDTHVPPTPKRRNLTIN